MRVLLNKLAVLITLMLMFCAPTVAQNVTLKTGNRGKPLKSIIEEIEKQTNYLFVYDGSLIDVDNKFNIDKENVPVHAILDAIFSDDSKISYKIRGNNIILLRFAENLNVNKTELFSIKMHVVDVYSQPVVGAVAYVIGKDDVVMTDIDGVLAMDGLSAEDVINISCMGFKDYTFQATQDYPDSITLAADSQLLDEVVVVGYGTLSSKEITSSITSISADEMMRGVGGADITKSLQGKIPGLVISQTKSVNDSPQMQLRGMASIVAGQEPLVVIDGFAGGDIRLQRVRSMELVLLPV